MKTEGDVMRYLILLLAVFGAFAQGMNLYGGGEVLNEVPIYQMPEEMTFEEYRDANRRISVGLMLMSIPVPGMLHFYAEEDLEGWLCVGAAGLGLASLATGAMLRDDEEWPDSDYDIEIIDGNRYEKIPISMKGEDIEYELRRQKSVEPISAGGAVLIGFGGVLIAGQLIYDWLDGIHTIEYKRDAVRYKYGIMGDRKASIEPQISPEGGVGFGVKIE